VASGAICQPGLAANGFTNPHFIAVDNSTGPSKGDFYVGDVQGTISKFNEAGQLISGWGNNGPEGHPDGQVNPAFPSEGICGIAVDTAGNLFVRMYEDGRFSDNGNSIVFQYEQNGTLSQEYETSHGGEGPGVFAVAEDRIFSPLSFSDEIPHELGPVVGLTFDPATDALFVVEAAKGGAVAYHRHLPLIRNADYEFEGPGATPLDYFGSGYLTEPEGIAIGATGNAYIANAGAGNVAEFDAHIVPNVTTGPVEDAGQKAGTLTGEVEPAGGPPVTKCEFEYGTTTAYSLGTVPCSQAPPFESPTKVTADITGLTTETSYHYRLVASNEFGSEFGRDQIFTPHYVAGLETGPATNIGYKGATLTGLFIGNEEDTTYHFEYVTEEQFKESEWANATPTETQDAGSPSGPTNIHFDLSTGLDPVTTYYYRVVAKNGAGSSRGKPQKFKTHPAPPAFSELFSTEVHSDGAVLHTQINPGGASTTYHFEYVSAEQFNQGGYAEAGKAPIPDAELAASTSPESVAVTVTGLKRGTTYHWRVVASNVTETTVSPDQTLNTFPYTAIVEDPCSNAHVRQQTGAAFLLDCRAYELVSAANTDGYPVESGLVAGQAPLPGYPQAQSPARVLYATHDGAIPGTGQPTNDGLDPYLATRGENGWTTTYVGIPANATPSPQTFASPLLEADPSLDTFAFGGPASARPALAPAASKPASRSASLTENSSRA
jgi:hypothetical protein